MIHTNKKAAKQPTEETIKAVYKRDKYKCFYCGGPAQGKPHHWAVHNTITNQYAFPHLVQHMSNLVCTDYACHGQHNSGDNLPLALAGEIDDHLAKGGDAVMGVDEEGFLTIYMIEKEDVCQD